MYFIYASDLDEALKETIASGLNIWGKEKVARFPGLESSSVMALEKPITIEISSPDDIYVNPRFAPTTSIHYLALALENMCSVPKNMFEYKMKSGLITWDDEEFFFPNDNSRIVTDRTSKSRTSSVSAENGNGFIYLHRYTYTQIDYVNLITAILTAYRLAAMENQPLQMLNVVITNVEAPINLTYAFRSYSRRIEVLPKMNWFGGSPGEAKAYFRSLKSVIGMENEPVLNPKLRDVQKAIENYRQFTSGVKEAVRKQNIELALDAYEYAITDLVKYNQLARDNTIIGRQINWLKKEKAAFRDANG